MSGAFRGLGRRIEGDPVLQYKIHKVMSRVWIVSAIVTPPVVIFLPLFWAKIGICLVAEISYYANWATDNGAMSAANASTDEAITPFAIAAEEAAKVAEEKPE